MTLVLDTCVCGGAKELLVRVGHEVVWTGEWPEDPGDEEILAFADRERRVVVTLGKDFGELAVVGGMPHRGIVRLVGFRGAQQGPAAAFALQRYEQELFHGAIVTVEPGHTRVRPGDRDEHA